MMDPNAFLSQGRQATQEELNFRKSSCICRSETYDCDFYTVINLNVGELLL